MEALAVNLLFRPSTLVLISVPTILAFGGSIDTVLLVVCVIVRNLDAILPFINGYFHPTIVIDLVKVGTALFAVLQVARYFLNFKEPTTGLDRFPAKPMLFPCRTAHSRIFPKSYSFSYSYLLVGVPVGWKGSVGGMLSLDDDSRNNTPWYLRIFSMKSGGAWNTVNGDDYLARGHVAGGLEEKLQNYLQTQSVDPKEYPYTYLLTSPRFLGYASNPVSIWNLYSAEKELKALILEVNNTFDERHIYFVKPDIIPATSQFPDETPLPPKLTGTWPKDFYVSVFNSRAGSYSLVAYDPLFPNMSNPGPIRTTITLSSSQKHAKLVARVFSTAPAIDPTTMSLRAKTFFLVSWWWVGFATFPRTVVQALILLVRKKIGWVFRPEPRRDTMPRHANPTEAFIEPLFRKYLRSVVEKSKNPLIITYCPGGIANCEDETMTSSSAQFAPRKVEEIEFKILTPLFYSRFIHYINTPDAFLAEQESATISISHSDLLSSLESEVPTQVGDKSSIANWVDSPFFQIIPELRNRPELIASFETLKADSPSRDDKRGETKTALSSLENFMLEKGSSDEKKEYAWRVLKMFVSEYIAFGWIELLDLEILLARSRLAWEVAGWLRAVSR